MFHFALKFRRKIPFALVLFQIFNGIKVSVPLRSESGNTNSFCFGLFQFLLELKQTFLFVPIVVLKIP